jgi:hypothetical protein
MDTGELTIRPKAVARLCATVIAVLVVLHLGSQFLRYAFGRDYQWGLAAKLYLGAEASVPNWFSSVLLLASAAVLFAIGAARRRRDRTHWIILGILFLGLSLDEAAALHDLVSPLFAGVFTTLARLVGGPFVGLAQKPNYAWEIPGAIFCLVVAAAYVPFLRQLPRRTRNGFVAAGATYVAGAIGVDFIEGWYSGLYGPRTPVFVALVTCEEGLEMIGAALFLYALLRYAESEFGGLRINLSDQGASR